MMCSTRLSNKITLVWWLFVCGLIFWLMPLTKTIALGKVETNKNLKVGSDKALRSDFFVATNGIDDVGRGSKELPWRTVGYALKFLKAGSTLNIRGGVYHEHDLKIELTGTADNPILIQGFAGEQAIIDGGFPIFRNPGNIDWELVNPAINEWRSKSPVGDKNKAGRVFGFIMNIPNYPNERVRLVTYEEAKYLRSLNETHAVDEHSDTPLYVGPGVWQNADNGHIHIRLDNKVESIPATRDPRQLSLQLSTAESVIEIFSSTYLTFRHLTFQNSRRAIQLLGHNSHLVFEGITTWASSGIYVPMGIGIKIGPFDNGNSFIKVFRSRFYNDHPRWLYWSDLKRPPDPVKTLESGAISLRSNSHDWEIAWNHFRGGFDGPSQDRDSHAIKYHHNLVEAYADDAFELEGDCKDVEVYENYIRHAYVGIALSPCLLGPVKIFRNVIANLDEFRFRRPNIKLYKDTRTNQIGYPFKFTEYKNTSSPPTVAIYQNTIVFLGREGKKDHGLGWVNHQSPYRFQAVNNLGYVVNGALGAGYGSPGLNQQIDGNLYYKANTSDNAYLLTDIGGSNYRSLATFRESPTFQASKASYPPGWEAKGIEGDPLFTGFKPDWDKRSAYWTSVSPFFTWPVETFAILSNSPARHSGILLPKALPDSRVPSSPTLNPDIGAIPYGEKFMVGPEAETTH